MSEIFISHAKEDNDHALAIHEWLKRNNWNEVFLDFHEKNGISAGVNWQSEITLAGARCKVVLIILSANWVNSYWCNTEFLLAKSRGKSILAVKIDDIDISTLPIELVAEYQLVDLHENRPNDEITFIGQNKTIGKIAYSASGLRRLFSGLQLTGANPDYFSWPPTDEPSISPYRGLEAYREKDAGVYFGRSSEIAEALSQIRRIIKNNTLRHYTILGASGSGKSSFIAAGLLPRLRREQNLFVILTPFRPDHERNNIGRDTLAHSLSLAFELKGKNISRGAIAKQLEDNGVDALEQFANQLLNDNNCKEEGTVLVITIDQAETLFEPSKSGSGILGEMLADLCERLGSRLLLIISIRSSNFEQLQHDTCFTKREFQTYSLTRIPRGAYKEIIEGPARRYSENGINLELAPELVTHLLQVVDDDESKDILPLLAFTLRRLFDEYSKSGELTISDLKALGGIEGSVEFAIKRVLEKADQDKRLPDDKQAKLALMKRGLIPWTAGIDPVSGEPCRNIAPLDKIPEEALPIIELLIHERLLIEDFDSQSGTQTVEPAHEAFLRSWTELNGWLQEDRPLLASLEIVHSQSLLWEANKCSDDRLSLQGDNLKDALKLLKIERFSKNLTETDVKYINECSSADAKQNRRARITKLTMLAAIMTIGLAIIAIPYAMKLYNDRQNSISLEKARIAYGEGDISRSQKLAGEIIDTKVGAQAGQLILDTVMETSRVKAPLVHINNQILSNIEVIGSKIFAGFSDATISIINRITGEIITLKTGVHPSQDDKNSNSVINLKRMAPNIISALHRDGNLYFLNEEGKYINSIRLPITDQLISTEVKHSPNGLIWVVRLDSVLDITTCVIQDSIPHCDQESVFLSKKMDTDHWRVNNSGQVESLEVSGNTLEFVPQGTQHGRSVFTYPQMNCTSSQFEISHSINAVILVPQEADSDQGKKCKSFLWFNSKAGEIVAFKTGQMNPRVIYSQRDDQLLVSCKQSKICIQEVGSNNIHSNIPLKPLLIPKFLTSLSVSYDENDNLIVAGVSEKVTYFFDYPALPKPILGDPIYWGNNPIHALFSRNGTFNALIDENIIQGELDTKLFVSRIKFSDVEISNNWLPIDYALLDGGQHAVLLEQQNSSKSCKLAVLDDLKIVTNLNLDPHCSSLIANNNSIIVFGSTWMPRYTYDPKEQILKESPFSAHTDKDIGKYLEQFGSPWGGVFSKDGQHFYVSHGKGNVVTWNKDGGEPRVLKSRPEDVLGRSEGARSVSISPDEKWLVTSDNLGSILPVINLKSNETPIVTVLLNRMKPTDELTRATFSPKGDYLATLSHAGRLDLFHWKDGGYTKLIFNIELQKEIKKARSYHDLVWLDEKTFAISADGGKIQVFSADPTEYLTDSANINN